MLFSTLRVTCATLVGTLLCLSVSAQVRTQKVPFQRPTPRQTDSIRAAHQAEHIRRTLDPALGRVPVERLDAIRQRTTFPVTRQQQRSARRKAPGVSWTEHGPSGFTGTLRTLLVDPADSTGHRVWAGSTTGGLWVNQDITVPNGQWMPVSNAWFSQSVAALAVDPTNDSIRYAATGDRVDNILGGGIWTSADKGRTWRHLPATLPSLSDTAFRAAFRIITSLAVTKNGVLLAGTQKGLLRSADQGKTWERMALPQPSTGSESAITQERAISVVRVGDDSLVYVASAAGQLLHSTNAAATGWVDITPPNTAPFVGKHTELVVAPLIKDKAQVLYAAQIATDSTLGGYSIRWLERSVNGGRTWQTMTRPTNPDVPDADVTLGFGDRFFTLNASPDSADVVYLTAYDRLYRSGDGGRSWSAGQSIGRATSFLSLKATGSVWGSESRVYVALTPSNLLGEGINNEPYNRSAGFGGLSVAGVAMTNLPGNQYRLTGSTGEPGLLETSATEPNQVSFPAYPLRPFVDQNEPTIQVAATTNGAFLTRNLTNSTGWDYISNGWGAGDYPDGGVDYDSRDNTFFFWSDTYLKATGIGTEPVISPLGSLTIARPTYLKVGAAPHTLFTATINTELYKLTRTNEDSLVSTRIDGGTFPAGSSISSIDVGATDSLLVVTLSNFGVASVWYTTNGGITWTPKDTDVDGLPDMPVYAALFNPADQRQVMLATELGVWSTTDITANSLNWTLANVPTDALSTMPLIRCTQLAYRPADGHIAVATAGRGVWETDAWTLAPPTLVADTLLATVFCAGSSFPVGFTLTNAPPTTVQLVLSDALGDFSHGTLLASGDTSPLFATVSSDLPTGKGYRLRLEIPDLNLADSVNGSLTINNLKTDVPRILDRRHGLDTYFSTATYARGYICPGDSALLRAYLPGFTADSTSGAIYQWALDGQVLAGQTADTLLASQAGMYSFTVSVAGCTATNADDLLLVAHEKLPVSVLTTVHDGDGPICPGTSVPLGITYLGRAATYQWLRNDEVIPGATLAALSVTETGAYSYSLTFGASGTGAVGTGTCTALAAPAYLTFNKTILPPSIAVINDVAPTLCGTDSLALYATQQLDNTTYQWLRNGQPLADQNAPLLTTKQGGDYRLQVNRGTCSAISNPIAITANSRLSNGFYFYGSTTFCAGETLFLYAKNTEHALQWTKNGVPIPDATGFSYPVDSSGTYGLRYSSGSCSDSAAAITVVVSQTLSPSLLTTNRCTEASLTTHDYPATGEVSFSWLRNGEVVAQGPQAYQTVSESGLYSVSVTNGVCSGLSKPVSISIGQPTQPVIRTVDGQVRCPNSAVSLERVSGTGSFWQRNGKRLATASVDQLVAHESGVYSLVYEEGTCLVKSDSLTIIISQPVTASVLTRPYVRSGQAAVVPIQLSGAGPWSFSVTGQPSVVNTWQNPYSLTLTPSQSTSYSLVGLANGCGSSDTTATWRVFVDGADVSLTTWVNKRVFKPGDLINYFIRVTNAGPDVAEQVTLINRLPPGVSYAGSLTGTSGDTLRYTLDSVPVGQSVMLSYQMQANQRGTFRNAVEVIASETPDPDSQPDTGTADGEDDASLTDWMIPIDSVQRASNPTQHVFHSPNPRARVLPVVVKNQPLPTPGHADLSLSLSLNKRVVLAQRRDTLRLTLQVRNIGGAPTSAVQASLTLPNGTYSLDGRTWFDSRTKQPVDLGPVGANETVARTVFWIPTASGTCLSEVISSSLPDPNSKPNNHHLRPGEDDEATADVRVSR